MLKIISSLFLITFSLLAAPDPNDPTYRWMDELIEKDFAPHSKGIYLEDIEQSTRLPTSWIVRIKVLNNQVFTVLGEKGAAQ